MLKKVEKEIRRLNKKLFHSSRNDKQLEQMRCDRDNIPYEIYDKVVNEDFHVQLPIIKSIDETLDKILQDKSSLTRFGDGEFGLIFGSRICYHDRSSKLAQRLKEVIASESPNLLIGLPPCFGSLDDFTAPTIDFWRRWMSKKREIVCSCLDMDRVYYNAFFNRRYLSFKKTDEHLQICRAYFKRLKEIWKDRDIVLFESQQARLGMANDLFGRAKSVSRIIFCPVKNAFDRYDEILSAFDGINSDALILLALGPAATVLAYDLCKKGYQAVDIGMIAKEHECFLEKEMADKPLNMTPASNPDDSEYKKQIINKIV